MRSYEKSNSEKPVAEPRRQKTTVGKDPVAASIKDAGQNYRKEAGKLLPKSFFVIVSGGEKREKDYFKSKIISTFKQIKIKFIAKSDEGNPERLLELAKDEQNRYKTSQEDEPDKIFIVSDVDHFMNKLLKIKSECTNLDISLIISNSCFEVWLYYGKFNNKPVDFKIPADAKEISQSFKTYLNSKVKGGIDPRKAIFDIRENIKNAKDNYSEDINGIPELFSTNMFLLAEALLPLIQDDLDILKAENTQQKKEAIEEHAPATHETEEIEETEEEKAIKYIVHLANGSYLKALELIAHSEETLQYLELFKSIMRNCWKRDVKNMRTEAENFAGLGREKQKAFLSYAGNMIRENFFYRLNLPEINYLNREEAGFAKNFSPYVNENNVIGLINELALAERHIESNVNSRMVFFDLSMKIAVLIKK